MILDLDGDDAAGGRRNPASGFGILFIGLVFVAYALCWSMAALNDVELPGLPSDGRRRRPAS